MKNRFLPAVLSLLLVACGGGGSGPASVSGQAPTVPLPVPGTAPGTTPVPTPLPTPVPGLQNDLQLVVDNPDYLPTTPEASAFAQINAARRLLGVGQLQQSARLDRAARGHAAYWIGQFQSGNFAVGHAQNPAHPGYTGATPIERINAAGYSASKAWEALSHIIEVDQVVGNEPGMVSVQTLLSGPYHRINLFNGAREIGIGNGNLRIAGTGGVSQVMVFATALAQGAQPQYPGPDWVGVWPVDGATGVLYSMAGESPDPIPQQHGACVGYPVSVHVREGQTLTSTRFTLEESDNGTPVALQVATRQLDANPQFAVDWTVYAIPLRPLKAATRYTARFGGNNNGRPVDIVWSFTTTARNLMQVVGCAPG